MNSVGGLLREARESLGFELPDVARGLRIRMVYLQDIEDDNYAKLPGKTYVLGFLRSYAEFLGLDGDDVITRYRRQLNDKTLPTPSLSFPVREPETRLPRGAILLLSVVLAAGAVYGGTRYLGDDALKTVDRVAPVPDRLIDEVKTASIPSFTPRSDPSSAFAAVTVQPTEAGSGAVASGQSNPASNPLAAPASLAGQPAAAPLASPVATAPSATEPPAVAPIASVPAAAVEAQPPSQRPFANSAPPPKPSKTEPVAKPDPAKLDAAKLEAAKLPQAPAEPVKPSAQQQTQALNQAQTAQTQSQPQIASLPPARPRDIVVVARVDSWIEVRDVNNSPLVSLLLRVGDSYRVPEGANYRLVTGDVRGLEVRVDGIAVRQRGADDNKPHRILSLDGERLRNGNAVID